MSDSPYTGYRVVSGWFDKAGIKRNIHNDFDTVDDLSQARSILDGRLQHHMSVEGSAWGRIEKVLVIIETERNVQ